MAESMPLRDSDSMANLLSSIVHSFRTVPPAAVPAMLNCIIASTGVSPRSLFDSLLRDFTSFTKDLVDDSEMLGSDQCMNLVSYLRALCHLLKKDGLDSIALESFIWHAFIRLIKIMQLYGREMLNEIIESFCEIVIATNNWEVIEATMVPFLLSSVRLFINMDKSEDTAITQRGRHSGLQDSKAQLNDVDIDSKSIISSPGGIPLTVSCQILCSLLDASVLCQQAAKGITRDIVAKGCTEEKFSGHMLSELSVIAIHMLSQSLEQRSVAVRFLLPSLFKAFAYKHSFGVSFQGKAPCISRYDFFLKLWKCSRMLFALGSVERRDAYGIISLYLSYFSCVDCPGVAAGDKAEEFDIRAEQEFWDEIKRGLVDKESLVRKQSLHILKRTLQINEGELKSDVLENKPQQKSSVPRGMTKRDVWAEKEAESLGVRQMCTPADASLNIQQKWGAFVLLYEMLEEYGTHLVEAAWNHQIRLLLHSSFQHDDFVNPAEEVNKRPVDALNMTFEWLAILWERGLSHDNPQVRCLIMQSFLEFEWKNQGKCIRTFPENFVLGPLIQGLNDPVHHKDFGLKGVYSSETIEGATRFFSQYSSYLWGREQVSFLQKLVSIGRQQCFGRAGLMSLVECISSASIPSAVCKSDIQDQSSSEVNCCLDALSDVNGVALIETQPCTDKVGLIDGLRFLIENSRQHFNAKYRLRVCEKIMKAAASIVCTHELPLEILSHFISALPREFTDSGGPLRVKVQEWLAGCGKRDCSVNCANNEMQVLQNLWDFPRKFIKHHYSASTLGYFDDEDLVAWGSELGRWARVLFLLIKADHDLGPLFMFIKGNSCICGKNNHDDLMPVKFLMLVLSLVHELQVFQRRIVDRMNAPEAWPIVEKFIEVFLVVLEGLVSFADSSCSIFWSTMVEEDTALPGAVIGKLGGPSQRRLSSRTTTAVLQAIVLIRTVASVSSWCASVRRDAAFDHALTFLWRFFQRVVSSPMCDSPTKAEIHLAEFEALSFILKALVPVFSSSAMTVIKEINALLEPAAEDVPLLDALVLTFLEHVNSFLAVGLLARTRKAVLMNWKWICLESLLSIPYYSSENEVQLECGNPLFSDGAVRCIFGDLVESLENAGEDSVLSMLRSVRMVLDLLTSGSSFISSCNGLDLQMMWQLVRSTWILHISCNKRRVASIAALLSSVLHASVFGDENMHIGNSSPGPLKWFCEKVLEEGTKSPRTIRLAALHLAGLWLSNPGMIKYYMKELKILTLYGSVAFDEDFEAELSENDDARTEVTLLAKVPDSEMTQEFINTELYARVSVAVLFHKLADLAEFVGSGNETDDCHAALVSGKLLLLELLDSAVNDRDLAKELYKKYSAIHRRKIRAWQMICVLSRFVRQDIVQQVKQSLSICLYRNNMPAVRQYLETFAISVYLKFPSLGRGHFGQSLVVYLTALRRPLFLKLKHPNGEKNLRHLHAYERRLRKVFSAQLPFMDAPVGEHLVPIFYDYDMRTQALSSYVFIAANVILHANKAVQSKHLDELLPPIIPLLTSHHHSLRGFTQLLVYQVLSKLLPAPDSCCFETAPLEKSCFDNLRSYLALNPDCMRLRASMERFLDAFSPEDSVTPAGIFSSRIEALEFECVPVSLMERVINFLNDVREDLRSSMAKDEVTLRNESLRTKEDRNCVDLQATGGEDVLPNDISLNFQRKFTFSKHEMQENNCSSLRQLEISRPLLDMEKEDQLLEQIYRSRMTSIEKLKANRQQFILVASLLDRIPNLAGLARTCEVFKATGLVIADANVLQDKQFQLISVTAEKWIPIIEVPEKSVEIFLEKKKAEGFSILGLEQTANSISLDKYIFPQKTVLVLGREKEGIPVEIIHILDACVEIPQLGVVRSLNVHVSGAIALWEYTRQQRFK